MTATNGCPLCTETFDTRTDLRVHLEVHHRKSEVVSQLIERDSGVADVSASGSRTVDEEKPAPSP